MKKSGSSKVFRLDIWGAARKIMKADVKPSITVLVNNKLISVIGVFCDGEMVTRVRNKERVRQEDNSLLTSTGCRH